MSYNPDDLKYTKEHEWVRVSGDTARVGLTDFAQRQLGHIVFVELPTKGDTFGQNEPFGSVESVKAVTESYMPVSGQVTTLNDRLDREPELINDDPYGDGWLIELRISAKGELGELLSAQEYTDFVKAEED
ncbi:glycine cleavage system protein GcvH [Streptomyces sp. NPDC003035]|uniref:glycine cleavage system protein GcvH n=1 Tax=Streptomyces sp. NPDC003035 TaxID=3364676 RepID=UPI0036C3969E